MRVSTRVTGIVVATMITGMVTAASTAHAATQPTTLYVNNKVSCSDTGAGSADQPFCTIQAAADAVVPGQTVLIAAGTSYGPTALSRSGTQDAPIVFTTNATTPSSYPRVTATTTGSPAPLRLSAAHDVTVRALQVVQSAAGKAVTVTNSQRVALDQMSIFGTSTGTATDDNLLVDGRSSDVTFSRGLSRQSTGYGVHVMPGATHVVVTTSRFLFNNAGDVWVSGAGAAVTGNTLIGGCHGGIRVDGTATGVTVENNVIGASTTTACSTGAPPLLSVAADSTSGTHVDYDALYAPAPRYAYGWGSTTATTAAAFAAASGQGAHELDLAQAPTFAAPPEGSPLVDSGDSTAPGVLDSDVYGNPHVDDPLVVDTGAGTGHVDRGVAEREDTLPLAQTTSPNQVAPFDAAVTVTSGATSGWGEPLTYTVSFGDGDAPVTAAAGATVHHTYAAPGVYTETITVRNTDGFQRSTTHQFAAGTAAAPAAALTVALRRITASDGHTVLVPRFADTATSVTADAWEVAASNIDFGDGYGYYCGVFCTNPSHAYSSAGTYTVTLTVSDLVGRTTTDHGTVAVGDGLVTTSSDPARVYDSRGPGMIHRVPAHSVVTVPLANVTDGHLTDAAMLNVTVTNPLQAGYVTAYSAGTTRPTTSTLNFAAGRTVANQVTAKLGATGVSFYNGSAGAIDLIVDRAAAQAEGGATYQPVRPVRVLDTRSGLGGTTGPVAAYGSVPVGVAGHTGVPADATAVLVSVTATNTKASGYVNAHGSAATSWSGSTTNWAAGQTATNLALVSIPDGNVLLFNGSSGTANFVMDLVGWYRPDTNSVYMPADPARLLDTRTGKGTGTIARLGAHQSLNLQVGGVGSVPATGVTAAGLNLTVTNATAAGFLTAYPAGTTRGTTSSLNYAAGSVVANATVTPVGSTGAVTIYNGGSAPVDVIADLSGYYFSYS